MGSAALPHHLREQLNQRLLDAESPDSLLGWLNSLPEVQALLAAEFDSRPINPANLSDWRRGGFRDWQVRFQALSFIDSLQDQQTLGHQALSTPCSDKLVRWLLLQYAAATQAADPAANPDAHLARLHLLATDIARLRRSDLYAEHIALEHQWLALEQTKTRDLLEKLFWAWTRQPEIKAKLKSRSKPDPAQHSLLDYPALLHTLLTNAGFSPGAPKPGPGPAPAPPETPPDHQPHKAP